MAAPSLAARNVPSERYEREIVSAHVAGIFACQEELQQLVRGALVVLVFNLDQRAIDTVVTIDTGIARCARFLRSGYYKQLSASWPRTPVDRLIPQTMRSILPGDSQGGSDDNNDLRL